MLVLGIDIGTTGAKAAVFNAAAEIKGYAFQEYDIQYPQPGFAEQDAEHIWSVTKKVIRQAVSENGPEIAALSLSVQGDAVIPVDEKRNALCFAQLGMDYRGAEESCWLEETFGAGVLFKKTGMCPHPMNTLVKILWIKNHQPELYEQTYKFTTYADFILGKLGSDELTIDYTMASRTMAFNLEELHWDNDILSACSIDPAKLSTPVPSGSIAGSLSSSICNELGLTPHTKLIAGGHDQTCAALGAGIIKENMALDSHGTAEVISTAFTRPRLNDIMLSSYYPCYVHTVQGMYFTFALNHTGGVLLKWFVENFCHKDQQNAEAQAEQVYDTLIGNFTKEPSPLLVLPYFNGSGTPTCNLNLKGAFLGLTMATTRYDIAKAIMEALSYELKINLDTMKKANIHISELRAVGGGARSPLGLQNKADILGIPVSTLQIREAACLGAGILAGLAIGMFDSIGQAVSVIQTDKTYFPNPDMHKLYSEKYSMYCRLYDTMVPILESV